MQLWIKLEQEKLVVDIIIGKESQPIIWYNTERISWEVLSHNLGPDMMQQLSSKINFLYRPEDLSKS